MTKMQYRIFKKLINITLVFCMLLAGCKSLNNATEAGGETLGGSTGQFVYVPEEFEKVEYAAMPNSNGLTMSLDKMNAAYRPHTDWRIYSIRTTKSTITTPEGCTSWYVSPNGSDKNEGKTPETAFKTLTQVNTTEMKEGDVVYFECNGLWRGTISAKPGVTYTSYGEGAKPQFRSYAENVAGKDKWLPTDTPNVYVFYKTVSYDVGLIVFNEGEAYGLKTFTYTRGDNGQKYDATTKKKFNSYKDLNRDLHFTHEKGKVYLRSDKGNPSDRYNSIELCVKQHLVSVKSDVNNVTIDNLCFKYGGSHGVGAGSCDGLTVTNSEFYWIGGSAQNESVRFGNGVEIYGSATNYRVENCYFSQIYDAAVTFQYGTGSGSKTMKMENINIKNNVMEYSTYSIEYFLGTNNEGEGIRNVNIEGNLLWYAGEGFTVQRPERGHAAHIKSWRHHKNPLTQNFVIKNNLFALSDNVLVETISTAGGEDPIYSNNIYIQGYKGALGFIGKNDSKRLKFTAENIKNELKDTTGKYIFIK